MTIKKAIGCAPFILVYGIQARLPAKNLMQMYTFVQMCDKDLENDMRIMIYDLMQLGEVAIEGE